jgi:peptidoglycan LD-endopeptidase CwlK
MTDPYKFSQKSLDKLEGVHPDLAMLFKGAIGASPHDFSITEGLRTRERQKALVAEGKSKTMNSRHLTGHAIDIAVYKDGKISWDFQLYEQVAEYIKDVAIKQHIPVVWGGDWPEFRDGPHFELNRKVYG